MDHVENFQVNCSLVVVVRNRGQLRVWRAGASFERFIDHEEHAKDRLWVDKFKLKSKFSGKVDKTSDILKLEGDLKKKSN